MKLLPYPQSLKRHPGALELPGRAQLHLAPTLPRDTALLPIAARLQSATADLGVTLELTVAPLNNFRPTIQATRSDTGKKIPGAYSLTIDRRQIKIAYHDEDGLRAAVATLRQLLREHGRRLPCVTIHDHPDFPRRGVMLDISRGRVPRLETLFELTSHLADFKINEFQLYTEHTFAYRNYEPVWRDWGALTGEDILKLDAHCRSLGIDLVPNQNSFGHLRYWLEYPPLKKLAETPAPWPDQGGAFLRHPATLAPNNPGTLPFLRELYDELLPNFTSHRFNVGCDETWDLGRGQSEALCKKLGKGLIYLDFLKKIHRETSARKKQMMFWGDIILNHPELVKELPKDVIALNWGYEATHPFDKEAATFARAKIPFYVCPGTSTWMTLVGRHDTAFANLESAAIIGRKHGAAGYLNTDWGDGGHLHPLAVSYLPYLVGAAVSWCAKSYDANVLTHVLSRDVFNDPTGKTAEAALALGFAHRKLKYTASNVTPLGATIAAPPPTRLELFCRDGLKYYARIAPENVRATLAEIETQLSTLRQARPQTASGKTLALELNLAARMAAQSCKFMLWQQSLAANLTAEAKRQATRNVRELQKLDRDFYAYWPTRNQGNHKKYWPCMQWRIADYRRAVLHFPPEVANINRLSTSAD